MKKFSLFMLIALGLFLMRPPEMADAKRLGGGGSFGSRPSYSQKYSKPTAPNTPSAQPSAPSSPLGGRGMFGGLMGGMLMGGLLGSLFFGGGFHGPSLLDLILIGGGLFLLFRFLRSRQPATHPSSAARLKTPNVAWDTLRTSGPSTPPASPNPRIPAGFNAEDFLAGAKAAYTRMQAAWDSRDLSDLRQFTSDEVYRELQAQAAADPKPGTTEILLLEARVLEARTIGNQTVATVLFDAMLREKSGADRAEQVREAWHFSRYETGGNAHWVVEGIQQMDT